MTHRETESAMRSDLESLGVTATINPDVSVRVRAVLLEHMKNAELVNEITDHTEAGDVETMRHRLLTHIEAAGTEAPNRTDEVPRRWWRSGQLRRVAAAAAAVVVLVSAVSLIDRSSTAPAQAALLEIAEALSVIHDPPAALDGTVFTARTESRTEDFITDTDTAVVDLVEELTLLRGRDGMTRADQVFVSAVAVVPSDPLTQAKVDAIYTVGVVTSVTVEGDEPIIGFDIDGTVDEVRRALDDLAATTEDDGHRAYVVIEAIRRAYLSIPLTPDQRATLLTVVATTPGVEFTDDPSGITASVPGPGDFGFDFVYTFAFDTDGWLVETSVVSPEPWDPWLIESGDTVSRSQITPPTPIG